MAAVDGADTAVTKPLAIVTVVVTVVMQLHVGAGRLGMKPLVTDVVGEVTPVIPVTDRRSRD
jgi:hypothetical protein